MRKNHPLSLNMQQEEKLQELLKIEYYSIPDIFMAGVKALSPKKVTATEQTVKK